MPGVGLAANVEPAPAANNEAVLTAPSERRLRLQPGEELQEAGQRRAGGQGRGGGRPFPQRRGPGGRWGPPRRPPPRRQRAEGRAAQRAERPGGGSSQEGQHAPRPAGTARP